jgi:hypothetical protein
LPEYCSIVGVLRGTWATRLGYAFTGFQMLLVASVAGMAVVMSVGALRSPRRSCSP